MRCVVPARAVLVEMAAQYGVWMGLAVVQSSVVQSPVVPKVYLAL